MLAIDKYFPFKFGVRIDNQGVCHKFASQRRPEKDSNFPLQCVKCFAAVSYHGNETGSKYAKGLYAEQKQRRLQKCIM